MTPSQSRPPRRLLEPITITLTRDQIGYLDDASVSIRKASGKTICRSALLRGFVRASQTVGLSFSGCRSEEQIASELVRILTRGLAQPPAKAASAAPAPAAKTPQNRAF